jgi:magnesium-transporting ATPase (P-type)
VYGATEVKHQRGSIGFLIPGCLLMSLGLFNVIEHFFYLGRYHSPIFWLIFGTGFLMIHLIHYVRNGFRSMFNASWPFVVSIIFYCISIVSLFHRFYQFMVPVWVRDNLFAILLVGVGAFFLIRGKNER